MKDFIWSVSQVIPLHWAFLLAGFLAALATGSIVCAKKGIKVKDNIICAIFSFPFLVLGMKIFYAVRFAPEVFSGKLGLAELFNTGVSVYGAFFGGMLGIFVFSKVLKKNFLDFCDVFCVAFSFGLAVDKIGCHFVGCCYGIPYDGPLSVSYSTSFSSQSAPTGVSLFPVQLLSSVLMFVLFIILTVVFLNSSKDKGFTLNFFLLLYPVIRFTVDFLRGDVERGMFLIFSHGQWISLVTFMVAFFVFILRENKKAKNSLKTDEINA